MPLQESDFKFLKDRHLPDQTWYRFLANARSAGDTQLLEDHLLLCPVCQAQYEEVRCHLPACA